MIRRHSLAEIEQAMTEQVQHLALDFPVALAVSNLHRAANAVRNHLTRTVLRPAGLTWSGFTVLWTVWLWHGLETREVAELASISKATLTGVVKTLERDGLLQRRPVEGDRRLVFLDLTDAGRELLERLYPAFNAAEAETITALDDGALAELTAHLRRVTTRVQDLSDS